MSPNLAIRRVHVSRHWFFGLAFSLATALAGCQSASPIFRDTFQVEKGNLRSTGGNAFFSLQPGKRLTYRSDGATLTITVLNETRVVDGVETRIVEEREEENGQLVEVSRNYFAADALTNDVYYFGEEVDIYRDGQVVSHDGAWLSGVNGARFGLIMPGHVVAGDRYDQEIAPGVAQDRAEHVALNETVQTPSGRYMNCLHVEETTPLEGDVSDKWYAAGVGLVRDDELLLVEVTVP